MNFFVTLGINPCIMKKYIVTVPEDKRALFDEVVRENHLDVHEVNETATEAGSHHTRQHSLEEENIPWIEARKLIDRNAT